MNMNDCDSDKTCFFRKGYQVWCSSSISSNEEGRALCGKTISY